MGPSPFCRNHMRMGINERGGGGSFAAEPFRLCRLVCSSLQPRTRHVEVSPPPACAHVYNKYTSLHMVTHMVICGCTCVVFSHTYSSAHVFMLSLHRDDIHSYISTSVLYIQCQVSKHTNMRTIHMCIHTCFGTPMHHNHPHTPLCAPTHAPWEDRCRLVVVTRVCGWVAGRTWASWVSPKRTSTTASSPQSRPSSTSARATTPRSPQ